LSASDTQLTFLLIAFEQARQLRIFRDAFGFARLRPDVARLFFVAAFVALRVELFADFVTAFRFGVGFDFVAAAFAGARFFSGNVFAFVRRLVGLDRRLRAAITAPDTAPINVPTTGVPTTVPTTAPATAPPSVLVAAPFSSLERTSFFSSSVISTSWLMSGLARARLASGTSTGARS